MLQSYLKTAFRNLLKYRFYSIINILGLSTGITVSILMLLFAYNTLTYDLFHENSDDIYFLYRERPSPEGPLTVYDTWALTVPEMMKDYPEIIHGYRSFDMGDWVSNGDERFREGIDFVDADFFKMFSYGLKLGDPASALSEKKSMVISQEIAAKYFGMENPLGKTLTVGAGDNYTITGVLDKIPNNSTFTYNILIPWENAMDIPFIRDAGWDASFLLSFVQLQPGTDPAALEAQFPQFVDKHFPKDSPEQVTFRLMPLEDVHNELTGDNTYAYILLIIALAILAIACINFTNLTTARSMYRVQEIGMRKVLGANRSRLIRQFLSESLMMSAFALIIGVGLAELFLPYFNELIGADLELSYFQRWDLLAGLILIGLLAGFFSGAYPALYLSRFSPAMVLKGNSGSLSRGPSSLLRNGLVVFQFILSVSLIIATGIVIQQTEFMKNHELRFDRENLIAVRTFPGLFDDPEQGLTTFATLKKMFDSDSRVEATAFSSSIPGRYRGSFTLALPEGWDQSQQLDWRWAAGDHNYFSTFGIEFSEGRNFSPDMPTDRSESIIINEAAKKAIGWDTAVGRTLQIGDRPRTIIGVVKDFHYQSLKNPIEPLIHFYRGDSHRSYSRLTVKLASSDMASGVALLQEKWQALVPGMEMDYFFVSDNFQELYQSEENLSQIVTYSAVLAILIACMGLFGLAAFTAIQRIKEIGIRKVLGATVPQIMTLLVKDFLKLVVIANVIAWPLGYFAMNSWLQEYPFRITIGPGVFLTATIVAVCIAILTVSYQAVRAAYSNPVSALRHE